VTIHDSDHNMPTGGESMTGWYIMARVNYQSE